METIAEISFLKAFRSRILAGETLAGAAALLEEEKEVFVVFDEAVAGALDFARSGRVKGFVAVEAAEEAKTMETVLALCRSMLEAGVSRNALLVAVGGGFTTDVAGFAAAIYKRGIRFASVPTTLLAQVDAAIGGKTGVNLDTAKNQLGAFHPAEWVYLCPDALRTLPERQYRCGLAEMAKTFLIAGEAFRHDPIAAARLKAEIVARDPFEAGERRKLNFGHTFGHAIESLAQQRGDDILHGEAVAMGIVLAARLGDRLGVSEKPLEERLTEDFRALGLPVECPYPLAELAEAMGLDKKAGGDGEVCFVLLRRPGETVERRMSVPACLRTLMD